MLNVIIMAYRPLVKHRFLIRRPHTISSPSSSVSKQCQRHCYSRGRGRGWVWVDLNGHLDIKPDPYLVTCPQGPVQEHSKGSADCHHIYFSSPIYCDADLAFHPSMESREPDWLGESIAAKYIAMGTSKQCPNWTITWKNSRIFIASQLTILKNADIYV